MNDTPYVLDSSAMLAFLRRENGWEEVAHVIFRADTTVCMSTVNYAEVLSKSIAKGSLPEAVINQISTLNIRIIAFDSTMAEQAGMLKPRTAKLGLSLGDCACLTLARHLDATTLTADKIWQNLDPAFRMILIR